MFNNWKQQYLDLLEQKVDLEQELRNEISRLENRIKEIENKTRAQDCSVAIDWKEMNVFSVERVMINNNKPEHTVLGYKNGTEIREWYIWCSQEVHEALVDEFLEYLNG